MVASRPVSPRGPIAPPGGVGHALLLLFLLWAATGWAGNRPNIVLLMSDDQGWGETGYNGHPNVLTPTLDAMARTGLRFDRFYAASPLCTPTRASLLTGRHANRSGAFRPNWATRPEEITVAHILREAGYRTGHFGKWHLGPVEAHSPLNPRAMGFDASLSHDNFFELDPRLSRDGAPPERIAGEGSAVIVEAALAFAAQAHRDGRPFMVMVHFGSPHDPYEAGPADLARYPDVPLPLRARFAEITAMDRAIGTLRSALAELGVRDDTLIWFKSDNGISREGIPVAQHADLFNGGWRGAKGELYEGGLLVPAILEWPALVREGRVSSAPVTTSDVLLTLLDLLDLDHPAPGRPLDGMSQRALIETGVAPPRRAPLCFWRYPSERETAHESWLPAAQLQGTLSTARRDTGVLFRNHRHPVAREDDFGGAAACRDERYKLVVGAPYRAAPDTAREELFDLKLDPFETHNLASAHPEIVARLRADLATWQRSVERSLTGADYR